jgi:hypothetical protein
MVTNEYVGDELCAKSVNEAVMKVGGTVDNESPAVDFKELSCVIGTLQEGRRTTKENEENR